MILRLIGLRDLSAFIGRRGFRTLAQVIQVKLRALPRLGN
jgi:hypothetical protein